jgi:transcriptional regulator with XRE-family HTH domain
MSFSSLRQSAGLSLEETASEFGLSLDDVMAWDSGRAQAPLRVTRSLEVLARFAAPAPIAQPTASNAGSDGRERKLSRKEKPHRPRIAEGSQTPAVNAAALIKSKQRVADHGEVFTPPWLVEKMLDLVKGETERIDSRFLEPACGSGNFLVPILQRKLAGVELKYGKSEFEKRHYALLALACLYGIELLADNIAECRANMLEVFAAYLELDEGDELYRAASHVLSLNLIHGDAMTMRGAGGEPITVVEWGYIGRGKFQRRDYRLDVLTGMSGFREEASLFAGLGNHEIFQPAETYPPMTLRELAAAGGGTDLDARSG